MSDERLSMRYSAIIIAAVAFVILIVAATPSYAQVVGGGKKGAFAKHQPFAQSPEEAFKEARERQCPVVLCIPALG